MFSDSSSRTTGQVSGMLIRLLGKGTPFVLLGLTVVIVINHFVLMLWQGITHYFLRPQLVEELQEQGLGVKSLDSFDAILADFNLKSVTINLHADWHGRDRYSETAFAHSATVDVDFLKAFMPLLKHQLELQAAPSFLRTQPVINEHIFSYIHNPHRRCLENRPDTLFTVPSAPGNFHKRMQVRNGSRGRYTRSASNNAILLFFVGRPPQNEFYPRLQQRINEEAAAYGDIVQENFEDRYRNIRLKSVGMLRWAITFCSRAKYVIRSDDDVSVNATKLVSAMSRTHRMYTNFILGMMRLHDPPQRDYVGKVFLSYKEYPESTFPPYALGGVLGYPVSTVRLLYQAALRVKPIWLDDVFITAFCAAKVNVPIMTDPEFVFIHRKTPARKMFMSNPTTSKEGGKTTSKSSQYLKPN